MMRNLGGALRLRFERLGEINDLDRAIYVLQEAVNNTAATDDPGRPSYFNNLGAAFTRRFELRGDLEAAISTQHRAVKLTPEGHPAKQGYLTNLGLALKVRFERLGNVSDLEASIDAQWVAVDLIPDEHPSKSNNLTNLGSALRARFEHIGDVSDLEASIAMERMAVDLALDGHPAKPVYLTNLGNALEARFKYLGEISDLEGAITTKRMAVELTPDGSANRPLYMSNFSRVVASRFDIFHEDSDQRAAIDALSAAAQSIVGAPGIKMRAARSWSAWSELINDEEQALRAYRCALGLVPHVAWMGLAIEGRHQELEQIGDLVRNAAAAAVRCGEHDLALEWLEQGRSVVWGQTLQLRSPVDLLRERDPIRAQRLKEISCALEANAKESNSTTEASGQQHRSFSLEWDRLLGAVRQMDGLQDFLGPKTVSQLTAAASSGAVVVLNVHKNGCDALVLMGEAGGVIHIPLELNLQRAQVLLDALEDVQSRWASARCVDTRHIQVIGRSIIDTDKKIKGILGELWNKVVKPVLDSLAYSLHDSDDDQPRICWCPTGPLAFLPIHAAGLYDSEEPGTKVFDFVVSSYTPTVTALLRPPIVSSNRTRILAIAQAQSTRRGVSSLPQTKQEIENLRGRAQANSIDLVLAEDGTATVQRVLEEMGKCNWIHLACHGIQDITHPTKSAFILADSNLELADIIKHPLPNADFAFLSACQTATGDPKLAEEAVHLAAGMMLAGYRSVIATMWSIKDKDGPVVADAVYAELLKEGSADASRAAHALHEAVKHLRSSAAPFMAWMPFIHMGA